MSNVDPNQGAYFLTFLKTLLTEAAQRTFDADYPVEDFRDLWVGIEFPMEEVNYPGIWVDFEFTRQLQIVGIDHHEFTAAGDGGGKRRYTRWQFMGFATYTLVAMTSMQRDRLFDEIVRVLAFGTEYAPTQEFRHYIEENEFLAINFDFDEIAVRGFAVTPGTPWGSNENIYECTVAMECIGEFVSDGIQGTLLPLSAVEVTPYTDHEGDPDPEW